MNKKAKEWLESIVYAFAALLLLFFLCWPFKVSGESMADTLHSGDRIVASRLAAWLAPPARGDLIVCEFTVGGKRQIVVKRVVGLPGDRVTIRGGALLINGGEWDEPYTGGMATSGQADQELAQDEYFVLGDNRYISFDSRAYGPVSGRHIIGKVLARWFPLKYFEIF